MADGQSTLDADILKRLEEFVPNVTVERALLRQKLEELIEQSPEECRTQAEAALGDYGTEADSHDRLQRILTERLAGFLERLYTELFAGDGRVHECLWKLGDGVMDMFDMLTGQELPDGLWSELHAYALDFKDLSRISDIAMQRLLEKVDESDLPKALRNAPSKVLDKFLKNMNHREMDKTLNARAGGSLTRKDIHEARCRILTELNKLIDSGEVKLSPPVQEESNVDKMILELPPLGQRSF